MRLKTLCFFCIHNIIKRKKQALNRKLRKFQLANAFECLIKYG